MYRNILTVIKGIMTENNHTHLISFLVSVFICGVLVFSKDTARANYSLANLQHKYVEVSGISFHYVTKGSGQPLILLHGFPETWYSWRKNIDALALYFQVIALDLKGYGDSDKPGGDYSLPNLSREIADLIRTLKLENPILVGHDWGGFIAWDVARNYPDLLDKLIILNAPLHKRDRTLSPHIEFFAIPGMLEAVVSPNCRGFLENVFRNSSYDPLGIDEKGIDVYEKSFCHADVWASVSEYFEDLIVFTSEQWQARFQTPINVPTLVIWAENDPRQPTSYTEGMEQIVSNLELKFIPECGHFLQAEKPEEVNSLILKYLLGDFQLPQIIIAADKPSYYPGEKLTLYVSLENPGPRIEVDIFLGVLFPDGSIYFFDPSLTTLKPAQENDARSYTAMRTSLNLSSGNKLPSIPFYSTVLDKILPGTYYAFAALAEPGSAQAGSINLVGQVSLAAFSFSEESPTNRGIPN